MFPVFISTFIVSYESLDAQTPSSNKSVRKLHTPFTALIERNVFRELPYLSALSPSNLKSDRTE